jgi:hypothetical protein
MKGFKASGAGRRCVAQYQFEGVQEEVMKTPHPGTAQ